MKVYAALFDILLAMSALLAGILSDFGGPKYKDTNNPIWRRITIRGWFSVLFAVISFVLLIGKSYINYSADKDNDIQKVLFEKRLNAQNVIIANQLTEINNLQVQIKKDLGPFIDIARARYPGIGAEEALKRLAIEVSSLQGKINSVSDENRKLVDLLSYEDVAHYGWKGDRSLGGGVSVPTEVDRWGEGAILFGEKSTSFKCDSNAIKKYRSAIDKNPKFPFPYYVLAVCLRKNGDPTWRATADNGISIFKKTTKIAGHDPGHDQGLMWCESLINSK